jgi:E3 ubiquitin-protein ligase UHRF1
MSPKYNYEAVREANIKRNKELLEALKLDLDVAELAPPKPAAKPKQTSAKKRKERPPAETPENDTVKHARTEENRDGPRRSARNSGKTIDYKSENIQASRHLQAASVQAGLRSLEISEKMGREDGMRIHNPYVPSLHIPP